MTRERWLAVYRIGFAALIIVALVSQHVYNIDHILGYKPLNYLSFFTVEANLIAVAALGASGVSAWLGSRAHWVAYLRGGATIYLTGETIAYNLLLRNIDVETALPWVNLTLHYIVPVVLIVDWLIDLPPFRIGPIRAMGWVIFPLLYLAYSFVRGPFVDWYPYAFLDPGQRGRISAIDMSILVVLAAVILAFLMSWTTRLRVHFERQ